MRFSNQDRNILISIIFFILIISLFQNLSPVYANDSDDNDESLAHSKTLKNFGTEVSNVTGRLINVTSINIELFSYKWNITDISLEFLDIYIKNKSGKVKEKIQNPKKINFSLDINKNIYKVKNPSFTIIYHE